MSNTSPALAINWTNISKQDFLNHYWQRRPVLLKNALPAISALTSPEELAGLAMEDFIDARIVTREETTSDGKHRWQVSHGPFDDYSSLQDKTWSLLVQGVDRYLPEVAKLLQAVDFIPAWRIDDVMVSYSTAGAGVGLHLDQYDVFIVQGEGKRHWQAGEVDKTQTQSEASKDLLQLAEPEHFTPIVDAILTRGDILYIPPFSAHKGETIEDAINYSIGFRAPNQQELLSNFADYVIDHELGQKRYENSEQLSSEQDSQLSLRDKPAFISDVDVRALQSLLSELINDEKNFTTFCLGFFTQASHGLDISKPEPSYQKADIIATLQQNPELRLTKTLGLRATIAKIEDQLHFACAGNTCAISDNTSHWLAELCHQTSISNQTLIQLLKEKTGQIDDTDITLLSDLINSGFWYWD